MYLRPVDSSLQLHAGPALSPGRASLLAFPSTGRLPSTLSAADLWSVLFEAS